jgi:hypothetical protein
MWSGNHKFYIEFSRLLRQQSFRITLYNTEYFTSDNEPNGIKMRPTLHFRKKLATEIKISGFFENILWGAFFIPLGSLSLVK